MSYHFCVQDGFTVPLIGTQYVLRKCLCTQEAYSRSDRSRHGSSEFIALNQAKGDDGLAYGGSNSNEEKWMNFGCMDG